MDEPERRQRLAYAIRAAREERGLTPPQLAKAIGRDRGTINKWESGERIPSLLELGPLCDALGVSAELFAYPPAVPASPVRDYLVDRDRGTLTDEEAALVAGVGVGVGRAARLRRQPPPDAGSAAGEDSPSHSDNRGAA